MLRSVTPELLDSLPPDSAAAQHSRRDLVWFNRALGTTRWWRRTLPRIRQRLSRSSRGIEVGAGDGRLARQFGLAALDLAPPPADWPANQAWHRDDITAFAGWAGYPLVCANLFLHHLSEDDLRSLGAAWDRHAQVIIACEPWRSRAFQPGFAALCFAVRAHAVSRHDGHVSIAAGFRGDELPTMLGLSAERWTWRIQHHLLGTYRFVAWRRKERSA